MIEEEHAIEVVDLMLEGARLERVRLQDARGPVEAEPADGHLLAYTSYNLNSSAGQTDCPRFTEQHDWAENWNRNSNGTEQEAITGFAVPANARGSWPLPDGTTHSGIRTQVTLPDGTYQQILSHWGVSSGAIKTAAVNPSAS